jgi:CheY-like chemotaxis protein
MTNETDVQNAEKRPIVLIMEPSILARLVLCDYLRDCGYRVLEASNAKEAITILDESGLPIDVVLSEVQLSGEVDGFTFAHHVRQKHPHIKDAACRHRGKGCRCSRGNL